MFTELRKLVIAYDFSLAIADIQSEVVFDRTRDRYLWMDVG
ncbi:XisI protein [aff. Roholtiella sp. LEGE 12411]|nr:XisI protein [aff. Roholtiella sp. LEGE 12411]